MSYSLEYIPEDIWTRNKKYKKSQKVKWFEAYQDVLEFCEEENLMYLFRKDTPKPVKSKKVVKSNQPKIRRIG